MIKKNPKNNKTSKRKEVPRYLPGQAQSPAKNFTIKIKIGNCPTNCCHLHYLTVGSISNYVFSALGEQQVTPSSAQIFLGASIALTHPQFGHLKNCLHCLGGWFNTDMTTTVSYRSLSRTKCP